MTIPTTLQRLTAYACATVLAMVVAIAPQFIARAHVMADIEAQR